MFLAHVILTKFKLKASIGNAKCYLLYTAHLFLLNPNEKRPLNIESESIDPPDPRYAELKNVKDISLILFT